MKREECIRKNLHFILGEVGMDALSEYSAYFNFEADLWDDWRMDFNGRWNISLDVICVQQDIAHRVVFKIDQPTLTYLGSARLAKGHSSTVPGSAKLQPASNQQQKACDCCVDRAFTCYRSTDCCTPVRADVERHTRACEIFLASCERIPRLLK